jgi:hypothetical protein
MLRRFLVGLVKGALIGALLAYGWISLFGAAAFGGALAYVFAIVTGALTGMIAGRPPWAKGAFIEVMLKTVAGALVSGVALYALRKWLPVQLELGALGSGRIGEVAAFALPAIAMLLGSVFELDNTGAEPEEPRARVAGKSRVASDELAVLEDAEPHTPVGRVRRKG